MDQQVIAATSAPEAVRCIDAPAWVEYIPIPEPATNAGDAHITNGLCRLLHDVQVSLAGVDHARYVHTAQRVLTRAGAESASHFAAEFDPSFERVDVHFIRVVRNGGNIEHSRAGVFQTFRRETNLERLVLNGRLTASLLIPDVRENDIVEIGMTFYGSSPALHGKYATWAGFDSFHPWYEARHRLLRPVKRAVAVRQFNDPSAPIASTKDGVEDLRWNMTDQQRRQQEELTPPWKILVPAIQFSETENWNEVACLFAPLYENKTLPDALLEECDRVAAKYQDPAQRAAEWLRFVQQNLRYFALSLGEGGLVPRGLDAIWGSRFGDCKDAARLYTAGAKRMGLDACAALTSTSHGIALDTFLPSHSVFDHCIVRLRLNGVTYWLDPTMQVQGGSLENIFQPHAGWALPLTPQTTELEALPERTLHYVNWEEEVTFGPKPVSPAKYRRYIEHFYWAADSMRQRIANEGTTEYAKKMLKDVQQHWPGTVETAPIEVRDDSTKNCVTTIFNYEIRDCWKPVGKRLGFLIVDPVIPGELSALKDTDRETDVYLGRPRKLTRFVKMKMPRRWNGEGWHIAQDAPNVSFISRLTIDDRTIINSKEVSIRAHALPAAHAASYIKTVGKMQENQLVIYARKRFGKIAPPKGVVSSGKYNLRLWFWAFWVLFMVVRAMMTAHR